MEPLGNSHSIHTVTAFNNRTEQSLLKKENQVLFLVENNYQMAHRDREIVIEINSNCDCKQETKLVSTLDGEKTPKQAFDSSPEANTEIIRRRNLDTQQKLEQSPKAEVVRCSSNASFRRKTSWTPNLSKTKSRLIDPPEEPSQKSGKSLNSGKKQGKNEEEGDGFGDEDMQDIPDEYKGKTCSTLILLQWVSLVLIITALLCNVWIPILKRKIVWDLPLWKWEILVLALICGRLVSGGVIRLVVIYIEHNFILRKRVLYFVYGLRSAVQNCLWLGVVLLVWNCIFNHKVEEKTKRKILPYVTKVLVCFLVGTLMWLLKTLLLKVLALTFHVNTFFERIREALFNQYVIETLSGPPLIVRCEEEARAAAEVIEFQNAGASLPGELRATLLHRNGIVRGSGQQNCPSVGMSPRFSMVQSETQDDKIPIDHLGKLNRRNISAWNMRRMINIVRLGSLSTLDESILDSDMGDESSFTIRTECQAKEAAKKIFLKVAKPGSRHIYLEDVMRFMSKDEALKTMHLFGETAEKEGISKSALRDWVVCAFRERKVLALSLNDTKTAVDELHNMLNIIVSFVIMIISLDIIGVPVTHFLVLLGSQLLLVVFIFGNTCKTIFEAIIFLFVVHPFDVGDRCEVEGVQMLVEEMNILTTVFLRYDNTKVVFPNSVLATKAIGNYYRSPDMGDAIEFCIHISTPMEKLAIIKERIKRCIESRSDHWHPAPMIVMTDLEDLNKVKMAVWLTHKINHQDMGERFNRRALLVEEIAKIFRDHDLEYRLLPVDVNVHNMSSFNSTLYTY